MSRIHVHPTAKPIPARKGLKKQGAATAGNSLRTRKPRAAAETLYDSASQAMRFADEARNRAANVERDPLARRDVPVSRALLERPKAVLSPEQKEARAAAIERFCKVGL